MGAGWDANNSALWSASVTSTGRVLLSNLPSRTTYPIDGFLIVQTHIGCAGRGRARRRRAGATGDGHIEPRVQQRRL